MATLARLNVPAPKPLTLTKAVSNRSVGFSIGSMDYYDAGAWGGYDHRRDWFWYVAQNADARLFNNYTRRLVISRARREFRNNALACAMIKAFAAAVGYPKLRANTADADYNVSHQTWWSSWERYAELTGLTLQEVVEILLMEMCIGGELFVLLLKDGHIQLVQSEFVTKIDYSKTGRPVAYHIQQTDGEGILKDGAPETIVDARYCKHIYDQDTANLGRGMPWLLPSLCLLKDASDIVSAKTKAVKDANQLFGVLKKQAVNAANPFGGLGGVFPQATGETVDSPANPQATGGQAGASTSTPGFVPQLTLRDGTIISLEVGEDLELIRPEYQSAEHEAMLLNMINQASAVLALPAELWFTGVGDKSYSGAKSILINWNSRRERYCKWVERTFLDPIHFWRSSKARNEDDLSDLPEDTSTPGIGWMWGNTSILDPEKEARAATSRIANGTSSLADELEKMGMDFKTEMMKRRNSYIDILTTAGRIKPGDNLDDVEVPVSFMLGGLLDVARKPFTIDPEADAPVEENGGPPPGGGGKQAAPAAKG